MNTLLLFAAIMLSCMQSMSAKFFDIKEKKSDASVFNVLKALSAFLIIFVFSLKGITFHLPTVIYGIIYGAVSSVSMLAGYIAICSGPLALSSVIAQYSLLIPFAYGIFFCNEHIKVLQYLGILFLVVSLLMINLKKKNNNNKINKKWVVNISITFLANGIAAVIQKAHQIAFPRLYCDEFMLSAAFISMLFFLPIILFKRRKIKIHKVGIIYSSAAGVTMGLVNLLTLILSGRANASIVFPVVSGGTIIANYFGAKLFFSEKSTFTEKIGIVLGIVSLVLLNT